MADQPTGGRDAEERVDESIDSAGPAAPSELWSQLRIAPIEIALPRGSGLTLRAYRPESEVTPTSVAAPEAGGGDDAAERSSGTAVPGPGRDAGGPLTGGDEPEEVDTFDDTGEVLVDGTDEDETVELEEAPLFLGDRGMLYLFRSATGLVDFVRSGAPCDLSQLDTWPELVRRIQPDDVVPEPDDTYELDLVVENLRGGHDVWDPPLLIKAGEIARDLGYAYQVDSIMTALATGSPLDDLDEALRAVQAGGLGAMFARRRMRKVKEQQATLAWRTVIGKISSLVDWRE